MRGRWKGSGNSHHTSWHECIEESGRVIGDTHISRKIKGKGLSSCITLAYLYGIEKNGKGRSDELKEEVGVREILTRKLVRSRQKRTGHMEKV